MSVITGKRHWYANHLPAQNAQATITKAAPAANQRLICQGLTVGVAASSTNPAAALTSVSLISGASGGSTFVWGPMPLAMSSFAGSVNGYVVTGIEIEANAGEALTLEFAAALGANTLESVWMYGIVVPAS